MLKDIKYKGINTESNGYDATAGQLAVAHNVVNDHGYLETLNPPAEVIEYWGHGLSGYKCVFKHEMLSGRVNYIFYRRTGDFDTTDFTDDFVCDAEASLVWLSASAGASVQATEVVWMENSPVRTSITTEENLFEITAVGNTLCVLTAVGMDYFVWKNGAYKELGTEIPMVSLQFAMREYEYNSGTKNLPERLAVVTEGHGGDTFTATIPENKREAFSNTIYGAVNEVVNEATEEGYVGDPFLVRYAVRLYDGTLTKHSSPIYMNVSDIRNIEPYVSLLRSGADVDPDTDYYETFRVVYIASELRCKYLGADGDLSDWKDVINGVEIYISKPRSRIDQSKPIETFICASDHAARPPINPSWVQEHTYSSCHGDPAIYDIEDLNTLNERRYPSGETWYPNKIFANMVNFNELETIDTLIDDPLFYRVQEILVDELSSYSSDFVKIDLAYVLSTLETQPTMEDDYYSHDLVVPHGAYAYNERLNLFQVERQRKNKQQVASIIQYFNANSTVYTARMYITLTDEQGQHIIDPGTPSTGVHKDVIQNMRFLFVPYPKASKVEVYLESTSPSEKKKISLTMHPHKTLNGARYFNATMTVMSDYSTLPSSNTAIYADANKVYTSEVGNPFYFPIGGINTIGTGKIMALASNVRAISQGQFGEFPLYVFTDSGIWMMEVDDKGLYKAKQPMSLDKVLPGSKVTSMDNAVAYVTERGLMLVSGSETKCISEVLDGKFIAMPDILGGFAPAVNWESFKAKVACVYDSDNRRLHVYNPDYLWHYVFSVRTGEWTTMSDIVNLRDTISGHYVDTEIGLIDFNEEQTASALTQTIMTRPISFETDAYKRMRDNILRGDLDALRSAGKSVSVLLQGSNDLQTWINIGAVSGHYRMVRRSGTPYKWFRWKIVINSLPRDYKLHGMTADVDVTGNNKLR